MSRPIIHEEVLKLTTVSGEISGNTSRQIYGLLKEVIVKPATVTTTYDIKITNGNSLIMFRRTSQTGEIGEQINLPIRGRSTVTIENASKDELFTIQLSVEQ